MLSLLVPSKRRGQPPNLRNVEIGVGNRYQKIRIEGPRRPRIQGAVRCKLPPEKPELLCKLLERRGGNKHAPPPLRKMRHPERCPPGSSSLLQGFLARTQKGCTRGGLVLMHVTDTELHQPQWQDEELRSSDRDRQDFSFCGCMLDRKSPALPHLLRGNFQRAPIFASQHLLSGHM